jgi:hypothetical protein
MKFEEGSKPFLDDYDGFPTRDGIYIFVDWLRTTMNDRSTMDWRVMAHESATTDERAVTLSHWLLALPRILYRDSGRRFFCVFRLAFVVQRKPIRFLLESLSVEQQSCPSI